VCTTFTADENAALIALLVGSIEGHPFPQSQQVQLLFDQEIEQNRLEDLVDE